MHQQVDFQGWQRFARLTFREGAGLHEPPYARDRKTFDRRELRGADWLLANGNWQARLLTLWTESIDAPNHARGAGGEREWKGLKGKGELEDEEGSLAHGGHSLFGEGVKGDDGGRGPSPPGRSSSSSSISSSARSAGVGDWREAGADERGEAAWPRDMDVRGDRANGYQQIGRWQQWQAASRMDVKVTHGAGGEDMQVVVTRKRRQVVR